MDRPQAAYSLEQIISVERSYSYSTPTPQQAPSPVSNSGRVLTAAIVVALLSGAPMPSRPIPTNSARTLSEVLTVSNQAMLATTESAQFRRIVRHVGPPSLEPSVLLGPELVLGDFDYDDELDILPPNYPTTLIELCVSNISWAQPAIKDLDAEFSYLIDELA